MPDTLENQSTEQIMGGQEWADPEIGGINDAFDKFFDTQQEEPKPEPKTETKVGSEETKASEETSTKEEKKPVEIEEIKIDDDFFQEEKTEEKVEEKTAESVDDEAFDRETEEGMKGMDEKAGAKWKELRTQLKEAKKQTVTPEIQKKIEDLELKAAEADGLRQRIEELSGVSARVRVESSEEYDTQVRQPVDGLYDKAKEIAELYEGDPKFLWSIITERDRKQQNELIKEHLENFSEFDRSEVYRMSQEFSSLLQRRNAMLDNAEKYIQKIEADRVTATEKALEEHKRTVQTFQRDIWRKYRDVIPGFVDENGNETETFKSLMNRSMSLDFSRATPRDQAFAAFSGVIIKHLVGQMNDFRRQLAEYEAGDERAVRAKPSTGSAVNASAASKSKSEAKSFVEEFAEADLI